MRCTGVERAMNMPPPPLWRAPTPPTHPPTIGGGGAFVRPLRSDADGLARHHSADLDGALAGGVSRGVPAGSGCSPVLPRRFSAEEAAGGRLPPLRLEDPLSLVASETTSPQRSPHHRSPQRSPTLRASGARAGMVPVSSCASSANPFETVLSFQNSSVFANPHLGSVALFSHPFVLLWPEHHLMSPPFPTSRAGVAVSI